MPAAIAFIPHPDDEAYSFGGTLALLADAGWDVTIACASSGERGKRHDGGATDPAMVAQAREREITASCRLLRVSAPPLWRLPDGGLGDAAEGPQRTARLLWTVRPDVVLTLGGDGAYGHPDHVAVHRWVAESWSALRGRRPALLFAAFPRGLFLPQWEKCRGMLGDPPHPPPEAIGAAMASHAVDIASVAGRKRSAIQAHASQLPGGKAEALFPDGIVAALMETETFELAEGSPEPPAYGPWKRLSGPG